MSKMKVYVAVLLLAASLFLIHIIVEAAPLMNISFLTVLFVWGAIFLIVLILFKVKQGINMLNISVAIFLSLMILILIPYVGLFAFLMNRGQK